MYLYEIQTGAIGESYVLAYVWANNIPNAEILFQKKNPGHPIQSITVLLDSETKMPFCTKLSDSGWERY